MEQPALQISDFRLIPYSARQVGKRLRGEEVEMPRLAEEIGLVGGDGVDQMDQLGLMAVGRKHVIAVVGEGRDVQLAQAPADADLHHGLFLGVQVDAGFVIDQVAKPVEIRVGEAFVARYSS